MKKIALILLVAMSFGFSASSAEFNIGWLLRYQLNLILEQPVLLVFDDVKVTLTGPPDCSAMELCSLEVVVFEADGPPITTSRELEAQDYVYETNTYDFHLNLDIGYTQYCAIIREKSPFECEYDFNPGPDCKVPTGQPPYEVFLSWDPCDY